jgi:4'-phosphopantetheinyl transferase
VNGVDVWVADLDALPPHADDWSILAPDETDRAHRFRFDKHRNRFVRCRALLRRLIAQAIAVDAAAIAFRYGAYGKPELDAIHFNVSHSENLATIALTLEGPIGIDVETIGRARDLAGLAQTAFSPAERIELSAMTAADQIDAFYRGWARKEAYMKLLGTGFSLPSDSFTVSLAPEPISFIDDTAMRDLAVGSGFACAIAMASGMARGSSEPRVHFIDV